PILQIFVDDDGLSEFGLDLGQLGAGSEIMYFNSWVNLPDAQRSPYAVGDFLPTDRPADDGDHLGNGLRFLSGSLADSSGIQQAPDFHDPAGPLADPFQVGRIEGY